MITLNTFPEHIKGFQKGIIKALGLQTQSAKIHIVGNVFVNLTLVYYLCVVREVGVIGIWIAKVAMETFLVIS